MANKYLQVKMVVFRTKADQFPLTHSVIFLANLQVSIDNKLIINN
jgi:hypothetical protein